MATQKDAENIIDTFLASSEKPAPAPTNTPKTDEDIVTDTGREADTRPTPVQKAASEGNETAQRTAAPRESKEERAARLAEEKAIKEAEAEALATRKAQVQVAESALSAPTGVVRQATNWLSNAPTPGGIGVLLLALIFFLWVIVPVNEQGDTRLKLLWYTLIGRTRFKPEYGSEGGGADFENTNGEPPGGGADFDNTNGIGTGKMTSLTLLPTSSVYNNSPFDSEFEDIGLRNG
jgi:hypothetical protein